VDFPSGSVVTDGQPFSGSVDLLTAQLGQAQERSLPGDFKALFEDARIEPVEIVEAVRVVAVGGSDVSLEAPATLTLGLDAEAEAVASAASELFWVRFDSGQTYWKRVNQPVMLQAGAASGPITTLGWWALATPAERTRGCVVGRVETPAGAPLPGAEVAYQEADAFGHHRTWADGNGRFCAAPLLDRSSEAWVFAMERDDLRFRYSATTTLPTASVAGDCATPSTCVDAGTVVVSGLGAR